MAVQEQRTGRLSSTTLKHCHSGTVTAPRSCKLAKLSVFQPKCTSKMSASGMRLPLRSDFSSVPLA